MNFGNLVAIEGVMFEVRRGEVVGLVGDNGAGKSTLVKVMNGFYHPNTGTMRFKGKPVDLQLPERRAQRRHRDRLPGSRANPRLEHVAEFLPRP